MTLSVWKQLSEDLAHSDKLNQSLRDINVEHLQMKYNNEQDILVSATFSNFSVFLWSNKS